MTEPTVKAEAVTDTPPVKIAETDAFTQPSMNGAPPRALSPPVLAFGQSVPYKQENNQERRSSFDYDRKPNYRSGGNGRDGSGGTVGIKEDG